jgi:hypothetical protein
MAFNGVRRVPPWAVLQRKTNKGRCRAIGNPPSPLCAGRLAYPKAGLQLVKDLEKGELPGGLRKKQFSHLKIIPEMTP